MPFCSSGDVCRESHDLPEGSGLHQLSIGTPQDRTLRPEATGPYGAQRSRGSGLSYLSEDNHNLILDALGLNAAGDE